MSDIDETGSSRRATDGLDWRQAKAVDPTDDPFAPVQPESRGNLPPQGGKSGGFGLGTVAAIAVTAALGGGLLAGIIVAQFGSGDDAQVDRGPGGSSAQSVSVEVTSAIAEVAANRRDAVVRIESTKTTSNGTESDVGSGVVIDTQGHVITNAHVVLGTDKLKIILSNGEERPAILVGHDYPYTDVAVLQIGPGGLSPAPVGDSAKLVLGQTVVAIGNPLAEFDGSVTVGIVSGLNRVRIFDAVRQSDLIQTDAAVNSGNSGGALLDLQGNFIGMPTAVLRDSGNSAPVEGIAFALPSNRVMDIANRIIAGGATLPRPSLGLDHVDIGIDSDTRLPRLAVSSGALVTSIVRGGPAETAGVAVGDVITSLAGKEITTDVLLLNALSEQTPETTVKVVLNRQGKIIEAEVRLATR